MEDRKNLDGSTGGERSSDPASGKLEFVLVGHREQSQLAAGDYEVGLKPAEVGVEGMNVRAKLRLEIGFAGDSREGS